MTRAALTPGAARWIDRGSRVAFALLALALGGRFVLSSIDHLRSDLDLNLELPCALVVQHLRAGVNPWSTETMLHAPLNIAPYAPVWFDVARLLPAGEHLYFSARLASLLATLAILGLLVFATRGRRLEGALLAACFLGLHPVLDYAVYARVDMLGTALAAAAVVVAARSQRARGFVAAGLLAALAVWTKQTLVAATASVGLWLIFNNRRALAPFALSWLGVGGALAAVSSLRFGEGFWWALFMMRWSGLKPGNVGWLLELFTQPLFVWTLAAGVATFALAASRPKGLSTSPAPYWAVTSLALALVTMWKYGANTNYFLEPLVAALVVVRVRDDAWTARLPALAVPLATALLLAALLWENAAVSSSAYARSDPARLQVRHEMRGRIDAALDSVAGEGAKALNLSPALSMVARPERLLGTDPFILFVLLEQRRPEVEHLWQGIAEGRFAVIATSRDFAPPPQLRAHIEAHTRLAASGGAFELRVPSGPATR
jgi:hypothetical protein